MKTYLEFEAPIADLDKQIEALRDTNAEISIDLDKEIKQLSKKALISPKAFTLI